MVDLAIADSYRPETGDSLASAILRWTTTLTICGLLAGLSRYGWNWAKRASLFQGT